MKSLNRSTYLLSAPLDAEHPRGEFPFILPSVQNIGRMSFRSPVTFIVGENGSGKSTIVEGLAVALGFNAEGGSQNFSFATQETHSSLHEYLRLGAA